MDMMSAAHVTTGLTLAVTALIFAAGLGMYLWNRSRHH
jgi:hypothetical protein